MQIKCINNPGDYAITPNKVYDVINETNNWYYIVNDKNKQARYSKNLFEEHINELHIDSTVTMLENNIAIKILNNTNGEIIHENYELSADILDVQYLSCCLMGEVTNMHSGYEHIKNHVNDVVNTAINGKNVVTDVPFFKISLTRKILKLALSNCAKNNEVHLFIFALVQEKNDYDSIQSIIEDYAIEGQALEILNPNSGNTLDIYLISKSDLIIE